MPKPELESGLLSFQSPEVSLSFIGSGSELIQDNGNLAQENVRVLEVFTHELSGELDSETKIVFYVEKEKRS